MELGYNERRSLLMAPRQSFDPAQVEDDRGVSNDVAAFNGARRGDGKRSKESSRSEVTVKFQSTVAENFQSWDKFLDAYYEPIQTALELIPFIGEGRADDLTQGFFMKLYERDILENRPAITG